MKKMIMAAALPLMLAACAGQPSKSVSASSPEISYMGRTSVSEDGVVRFNYPGVTAMLSFTGDSLRMLTNRGSGYWMVEVDSLPPVKHYVSPDDSIVNVAAGAGSGNHTARITYCIEGYEFNPEIREFQLAEGGRLLSAPEKGNLKIEFIGNSITCGYGTEAKDESVKFSYDTENHTLGYAYLTARALDADFNMVCRSGIGIYRNFGDSAEGNDSTTMPSEYAYTRLYDHGERWDFSRFTPDVVCVNLGTNDTWKDDFRKDLFSARYSGFVDSVRGHYPEAKIVLLTGSMLHGWALDSVKEVLDSIASSREGVYRFDMTPQDGSLGYGGDWHPSAARSRKMAEELTAYLKSII